MSPANELAAMLLFMLQTNNTPQDLSKIFLTDSGSVAAEVALKMALQYHGGVRYMNAKTRIFSVRGGYHGDTLGAMSVCDPINEMHADFRGALPKPVFVSRPLCDATC